MSKLKNIRHMQAAEDGIIYYYPCATKACTAIIKDDGTIGIGFLPIFSRKLPNTFINEDVIEDKFSYLKPLIFDAILIFLAALLKNETFFLVVTMFSLFISLNLFKLLHVIYEMKISKRLYKTSKFVAASHMATNAYKKLQRIPTLEEVKKYSRFSSDSKICMPISGIFSQTMLIIFLIFFNEVSFGILVLFSIIIPVVSFFITTSGILNFLQVFVTSKPSDEELKVAITGIRLYEKMEDAEVRFYD